MEEPSDVSISSTDTPVRSSVESKLPFFEFSESTTDSTYSIAQVCKTIVREYRSDFELPCQTHIALWREERSQPATLSCWVSLDLTVGFTELSLAYEPTVCRRLDQHLEDDLWAELMSQYDRANDSELLRQLEQGCRREPNLYQIKRTEKQRRKQVVIDNRPPPTVRVIHIDKRSSRGSVDTSITDVTGVGDDAGSRAHQQLDEENEENEEELEGNEFGGELQEDLDEDRAEIIDSEEEVETEEEVNKNEDSSEEGKVKEQDKNKLDQKINLENGES